MSNSVEFDPGKTALLAMDFQSSILSSLENPAPLLGRVADAISALRACGGRIGTVRVGFTEKEVACFPAHSAMGQRIRAAGSRMHADAASTAVVEAIGAGATEISVRKTRVGAFSTTDLDPKLKRAGIDTVVLAGVHTSGVVLTTVREAHDRDYQVVVLADGCADPDLAVHEFLIHRIFPKQSLVLRVAQFKERL